MIVWGFTGTRDGMTNRQKAALECVLLQVSRVWLELHQGACLGADEDCVVIAYRLNFGNIVSHPSTLGNYTSQKALQLSSLVLPVKQPLMRDHDIVDLGELLIAAPKSLQEEQRSGTWATIRYARKLGKPVIILEP